MPHQRPRPGQLDSPLLPRLFKYMAKVQVWCFDAPVVDSAGHGAIAAGFRKPVPVLLLDHRGRKSGRLYTTPLLYMTDGPDTVVVASQGGLPKDPQWYVNLRSHPDTHVQIRAERRPVRARTADARERSRLWPLLLEVYADFETYQAWTEREIPVVILQPRAE